MPNAVTNSQVTGNNSTDTIHYWHQEQSILAQNNFDSNRPVTGGANLFSILLCSILPFCFQVLWWLDWNFILCWILSVMVTVELQSVNLSWLHFELHMESHFWLQLVLCGLRMWLYAWGYWTKPLFLFLSHTEKTFWLAVWFSLTCCYWWCGVSVTSDFAHWFAFVYA